MKSVPELISQLTEIAEHLGLMNMVLIWDGDTPVSISLTEDLELGAVIADAILDAYPDYEGDYLTREQDDLN